MSTLPMFPPHFSLPSTFSKPTIIFLPSKQKHDNPHPKNITMVTSWFNLIKVTDLIFDPEKGSYSASSVVKRNINCDHRFIAASSLFGHDRFDQRAQRFSQQQRFISLYFDYKEQKETGNSLPRISIVKKLDLVNYMDSADQYKLKAEKQRSQPLKIFKDSNFQDMSYSVVGP